MLIISVYGVSDAGLTVWLVELHRIQRGPPKAQCLHVKRSSTCSRALRRGCYFRLWVWATSDCLSSMLEAVPWSAKAYWSKISRFVFIRHTSLCSCIAAVIAWSRYKVSHHWPGLISRSQADAGAPTHSRKRGWFSGTPSPPSGGAWSSTL